MDDYESKKFITMSDNIALKDLLDMWAEKVGTLSNGTVENYLGAIRCIKKHPIADRKLKTVPQSIYSRSSICWPSVESFLTER